MMIILIKCLAGVAYKLNMKYQELNRMIHRKLLRKLLNICKQTTLMTNIVIKECDECMKTQ